MKEKIYDENLALYHGREDAIGSTNLRDYIKNPIEFRDKYITKVHPDLTRSKPRAFVIGQAFEDMVDENVNFEDRYIQEPLESPKKPTSAQLKAAKPTEKALESINFWEQFKKDAAGKDVLSIDECMQLEQMRQGFLKNKEAVDLWESSKKQVTYRSPFKNKLIQCRFDALIEEADYGIDLKTTSGTIEDFAKSVVAFRYDIQQAFYSGIYELVEGKGMSDFDFIVVEKQYPFRTQVITLPDEVVFNAIRVCNSRLVDLINAIECNHFEEHEEKSTAEFKQWQLKELGL